MLNALFCPVGEHDQWIGLRLVGDGWLDQRVLGAYESRDDAKYVGGLLVSWLRAAMENGIKLTDEIVDQTFRNAHGALRWRPTWGTR